MESFDHRPVNPVEPIAPWLGGKRHLAQHIASIIAGIPHRTYVEPFMGMGGVFLRRRQAAPSEAINDINRDLVTLYRVTQRHPAALIDAFGGWTLSSRDLFDRLKRTPPEILTDIERAARFLYLQRMTFGGNVKNPSLGVDLGSPSRLRLATLNRQLDALHRRLEGVIIECLPWQEVLERYDRDDTLFYLDPPYWGGEADYGQGVFSRSSFAELARCMAALKGRFLLSINDTPEIRQIFAPFSFEERAHTFTMGASSGAATKALELIVSDGRGGSVVGPLFG